MKRNACLAILFSLLSTGSFSQLHISGGINYGGYKMADIRDLKSEFREQISAIPVKNVDDFPAYIGYELHVLTDVNSVRLGFFGGFNSTGARLYYEDYSGSLAFDQLLKSISLDASIEYPLKKKSHVEFFVSAKSGFQLSNYQLEYRFNVGPQVEYSTVQFQSTNINLIPGIGLKRSFGKFFVQGEIRYHIDIVKGDLALANDPDAKLVNAKGDYVSTDWSGIRLALLVGFTTNKLKE